MLLAIHSYPGANATVKRHWPYFLAAGVDRIVGISTENGGCEWPDGIETTEIGDGKYMNGPNLPTRLVRTMQWCLSQVEDRFCIIEYDTLFFRPIPKDWKGVAAFRAGGQTFGSKSTCFYHNPWLFDRESGEKLVAEMWKIIYEGHCGYGTPESSPDVFFGMACERADIEVQQLLYEYSRNSFYRPEFLDEARQHIREGCHVVHGVKKEEELTYITAPQLP